MMGPTHALSGVAAFLAAAQVVESVSAPVSPGELGFGALVAAGAALAPDFDHRNSTAANTYGFITAGIARVVNAISGGHRNGTHSVLGVIVFTVGAWAASLNIIAAGIVCWLLGGTAASAFGLVSHVYPKVTDFSRAIIVGAAVTALLYFAPGAVWVLPIAMGVGVVAHILGDCVTDMGCPLGWPFSQRMLNLPLVDTNGLRERYLVVPGLAVVSVVLAARNTGIWEFAASRLPGIGA